MNMKIKENGKGTLVAFCGLYCGDCHGFKQNIPDLARDLRKELRSSKYKKFAEVISREKFGEVFKDYDRCYAVLGEMVKFRCKKGCRNGGGPPFCRIRKCCEKNGFEGCWECKEFETCTKLDFLKGVHDDGHIKNLKKIKRSGIDTFINGKRYW